MNEFTAKLPRDHSSMILHMLCFLTFTIASQQTKPLFSQSSTSTLSTQQSSPSEIISMTVKFLLLAHKHFKNLPFKRLKRIYKLVEFLFSILPQVKTAFLQSSSPLLNNVSSSTISECISFVPSITNDISPKLMSSLIYELLCFPKDGDRMVPFVLPWFKTVQGPDFINILSENILMSIARTKLNSLPRLATILPIIPLNLAPWLISTLYPPLKSSFSSSDTQLVKLVKKVFVSSLNQPATESREVVKFLISEACASSFSERLFLFDLISDIDDPSIVLDYDDIEPLFKLADKINDIHLKEQKLLTNVLKTCFGYIPFPVSPLEPDSDSSSPPTEFEKIRDFTLNRMKDLLVSPKMDQLTQFESLLCLVNQYSMSSHGFQYLVKPLLPIFSTYLRLLSKNPAVRSCCWPIILQSIVCFEKYSKTVYSLPKNLDFSWLKTLDFGVFSTDSVISFVQCIFSTNLIDFSYLGKIYSVQTSKSIRSAIENAALAGLVDLKLDRFNLFLKSCVEFDLFLIFNLTSAFVEQGCRLNQFVAGDSENSSASSSAASSGALMTSTSDATTAISSNTGATPVDLQSYQWPIQSLVLFCNCISKSEKIWKSINKVQEIASKKQVEKIFKSKQLMNTCSTPCLGFLLSLYPKSSAIFSSINLLVDDPTYLTNLFKKSSTSSTAVHSHLEMMKFGCQANSKVGLSLLQSGILDVLTVIAHHPLIHEQVFSLIKSLISSATQKTSLQESLLSLYVNSFSHSIFENSHFNRFSALVRFWKDSENWKLVAKSDNISLILYPPLASYLAVCLLYRIPSHVSRSSLQVLPLTLYDAPGFAFGLLRPVVFDFRKTPFAASLRQYFIENNSQAPPELDDQIRNSSGEFLTKFGQFIAGVDPHHILTHWRLCSCIVACRAFGYSIAQHVKTWTDQCSLASTLISDNDDGFDSTNMYLTVERQVQSLTECLFCGIQDVFSFGTQSLFAGLCAKENLPSDLPHILLDSDLDPWIDLEKCHRSVMMSGFLKVYSTLLLSSTIAKFDNESTDHIFEILFQIPHKQHPRIIKVLLAEFGPNELSKRLIHEFRKHDCPVEPQAKNPGYLQLKTAYSAFIDRKLWHTTIQSNIASSISEIDFESGQALNKIFDTFLLPSLGTEMSLVHDSLVTCGLRLIERFGSENWQNLLTTLSLFFVDKVDISHDPTTPTSSNSSPGTSSSSSLSSPTPSGPSLQTLRGNRMNKKIGRQPINSKKSRNSPTTLPMPMMQVSKKGGMKSGGLKPMPARIQRASTTPSTTTTAIPTSAAPVITLEPSKIPLDPLFVKQRRGAILFLGSLFHFFKIVQFSALALKAMNLLFDQTKFGSEMIQRACCVASSQFGRTYILQKLGESRDLEKHIKRALGLLESPIFEIRKSGAYVLAGLVNGIGTKSLTTYGILETTMALIEDVASPHKRQGGLFALHALCSTLKSHFNPFAIQSLGKLLVVVSDSNPHVKSVASDTAAAFISQISTESTYLTQLTNILTNGLEEKNHQIKIASTHMLGVLASFPQSLLAPILPTLIPKLVALLRHSHSRVSSTALKSLQLLCVFPPQVAPIVQQSVLKAFSSPSEISPALDVISKTNFESLEPSLSFIFPVLVSGLSKANKVSVKMQAIDVLEKAIQVGKPQIVIHWASSLVHRVKHCLIDSNPILRSKTAPVLSKLISNIQILNTGSDALEESFSAASAASSASSASGANSNDSEPSQSSSQPVSATTQKIISNLVDWLSLEISANTNQVSRSGAALGLAYICSSLPERKVHLVELAFESCKNEHWYVRHGWLTFIGFLPETLGPQLLEENLLESTLKVLLMGLSDSADQVRDAAVDGTASIIQQFGQSGAEKLMGPLYQGLSDPSWRIRQSSLRIALLFLTSDTIRNRIIAAGGAIYNSATLTVDSKASSQASSHVNSSSVPDNIPLDISVDEKSWPLLVHIFTLRFDTTALVADQAQKTWRRIVFHQQKTLKVLLPIIFSQCLDLFDENDPNKTQMAADSIASLCSILGKRHFGDIIRRLSSAISQESASPLQTAGIFTSLAGIVRSIDKLFLISHLPLILPLIQESLTSEQKLIRSSAAHTFSACFETLGSKQALELIVQPCIANLDILKTSLNGFVEMVRYNPVPLLEYSMPLLLQKPISAVSLECISKIVGVAKSHIKPYVKDILQGFIESYAISISPEFFPPFYGSKAKQPLYVLKMRSESAKQKFYADFFSTHSEKEAPPSLPADLTPIGKENINGGLKQSKFEKMVKKAGVTIFKTLHDSSFLTLLDAFNLSITQPTTSDFLLAADQRSSQSPSDSKNPVIALPVGAPTIDRVFRRYSILATVKFIHQLFKLKSESSNFQLDVNSTQAKATMRALLQLYEETHPETIKAAIKAAAYYVQLIREEEFHIFTPDIHSYLRNYRSNQFYSLHTDRNFESSPDCIDAGSGIVLNGFAQKKGVNPFVVCALNSLRYGSPGSAAEMCSEILLLTPTKQIQPHTMKITGQLVYKINNRLGPKPLVKIFKALKLNIDRGGIDPFSAQLETIFLRALEDGNKNVRSEAASALGRLMDISTMAARVESVFGSLTSSISLLSLNENTQDFTQLETYLRALEFILQKVDCLVEPPPFLSKLESILTSKFSHNVQAIRLLAARCYGRLFFQQYPFIDTSQTRTPVFQVLPAESLKTLKSMCEMTKKSTWASASTGKQPSQVINWPIRESYVTALNIALQGSKTCLIDSILWGIAKPTDKPIIKLEQDHLDFIASPEAVATWSFFVNKLLPALGSLLNDSVSPLRVVAVEAFVSVVEIFVNAASLFKLIFGEFPPLLLSSTIKVVTAWGVRLTAEATELKIQLLEALKTYFSLVETRFGVDYFDLVDTSSALATSTTDTTDTTTSTTSTPSKTAFSHKASPFTAPLLSRILPSLSATSKIKFNLVRTTTYEVLKEIGPHNVSEWCDNHPEDHGLVRQLKRCLAKIAEGVISSSSSSSKQFEM